MSSVECLREFVNERLTAAAEEIFRVFKQTVVKYEEEIDRQRRLLDIIWKPEITLHRIELPQQHVCKEKEVLTDQPLANQERNSCLDQEEPEPPQVKEELPPSQKGGQHELKQETDSSVLTPVDEESVHSEDQTLYFEPDKTQSAAEKNSAVNVPVITSVVSVSRVAKRRAQRVVKHRDSRSTRNEEPEEPKTTGSKVHCKNRKRKKSFKCDTCGKVFQYKFQFYSHMRGHKGERLYSCDTCGETFSDANTLNYHMAGHTGPKLHTCKTCGKSFNFKYVLKRHMRVHAGEKPYSCSLCKLRFTYPSDLRRHLRIHTGERPFSCNICGKRFTRMSDVKRHTSTHTKEQPYTCITCGKKFKATTSLVVHTQRAHTGMKRYICETCGKKYRDVACWKRHVTLNLCK